MRSYAAALALVALPATAQAQTPAVAGSAQGQVAVTSGNPLPLPSAEQNILEYSPMVGRHFPSHWLNERRYRRQRSYVVFTYDTLRCMSATRVVHMQLFSRIF